MNHYNNNQFMKKYNDELRKCSEEIKLVYAYFKNSKYVIHPMHNDSLCFKYNLDNKYTLSISIPTSRSGNRYEDNNLYPTLIETLLFCNGQIIHKSDWGYDDVCSFNSGIRASDITNVGKIVSEIIRLKKSIIYEQSICSYECNLIYLKLVRLDMIDIDNYRNKDLNCFQVDLRYGYTLSISVSVPLKSTDYHYPTIIETSLFYNNKMIYKPTWGYDGVCSFNSDIHASESTNVEKLVPEINRLIRMISLNS
jgi:hypothetical protein